MGTPRLLFKKLRDDAVVPRYMTPGAAGMDLCAALDGPVELAPGHHAAISTGLAVAIPPGWEGQVRPRSGLARDHGVTVANAPGTIDSDYRGPVTVLLVNLGTSMFVAKPGMRIAQLVIAPVAQAEIAVVEALPDTERGAGGFGSTGR